MFIVQRCGEDKGFFPSQECSSTMSEQCMVCTCLGWLPMNLRGEDFLIIVQVHLGNVIDCQEKLVSLWPDFLVRGCKSKSNVDFNCFFFSARGIHIMSRNTHVTFPDNIRLLPGCSNHSLSTSRTSKIPGTSLPCPNSEDIHF